MQVTFDSCNSVSKILAFNSNKKKLTVRSPHGSEMRVKFVHLKGEIQLILTKRRAISRALWNM